MNPWPIRLSNGVRSGTVSGLDVYLGAVSSRPVEHFVATEPLKVWRVVDFKQR